jgi:hypothetical protein
MGLRNEFVESLFPTLKRGANKLCAYGASARALFMQPSIKLGSFFGGPFGSLRQAEGRL